MMTEHLIAYLAGAIDCDGSISIHRSTYKQRVTGNAKVPIYSERIAFGQVGREIIDLLLETFGGSLYQCKGYTPNARSTYRWSVTNRQAAEALRLLLPYLRVKKAQAELVLALRAHKDLPVMTTRILSEETHLLLYGGNSPRYKGKWVKVRKKIMSPESIAYRNGLFERVRALQQHGLNPLAYPAKRPKLL